jgi:hypothetical protein
MQPVTFADLSAVSEEPDGTIYDDLTALGSDRGKNKHGPAIIMSSKASYGGVVHYAITNRGDTLLYDMRRELKREPSAEDVDEELGAYFEAKRHTRG